MKPQRFRLLSFFFMVAVSYPAFALKCGSDLVQEGERKIEVLKKCGEPASIDRRIEYESVQLHSYQSDRFDRSGNGVEYQHQRPIYIEEWTYNFGPKRLMRVIYFVNGVITKIELLGYGYREEGN